MAESEQENFLSPSQASEDSSQELDYLRSKVSDLSSLIETSIIINSTLELDALVRLVMEKAQSVMKAEASFVMLLNKEGDGLECTVALGEVGDQVKKIQLKIGEGIAGWVAQHGKPQIVPDVSNDPRFSSKTDNSTGFQTRSILAAPLMVKDKVIGVAEVINPLDGKPFDNDDLDLFSTFCRQVAMAIENTRMHKLKMEQQRLQHELESAKIIQESFMPESLPNLANPQFSIAAKSLPAAMVGGDFYDFIEFDSNTLGVAVGDVTGKGVPAALYMARLVSDFRQHAQRSRLPSVVFESLNRLLVERSRRGMFVTMQYGILNAEDGKFVYSNAGHIPYIRISNKLKIELLSGAKTIPLGIAPELEFEQASVQLKKGDFVVSITDGIIEAKNRAGEEYSLNRTLDMLSKSKGTAEEMVESLIADVQAFSEGTDQHDDLTVLAMQWN